MKSSFQWLICLVLLEEYGIGKLVIAQKEVLGLYRYIYLPGRVRSRQARGISSGSKKSVFFL